MARTRYVAIYNHHARCWYIGVDDAGCSSGKLAARDTYRSYTACRTAIERLERTPSARKPKDASQ